MEIYHYGRKKKIVWIVVILALIIAAAYYTYSSPVPVEKVDEAARSVGE